MLLFLLGFLRLVALSLVEIADHFETSEPTVRGWIKDGCPVLQQGGPGKAYQLDLDAVIGWRLGVKQAAEDAEQAKAREVAEREPQLDLARMNATGVDAAPTRLRMEYYEAEFKRHRLARERGELVLRADMAQAVRAMLGFINDRLQALPDDLERAANLQPEAVERIVRAIDVIQDEMARQLAREFEENVRRLTPA